MLTYGDHHRAVELSQAAQRLAPRGSSVLYIDLEQRAAANGWLATATSLAQQTGQSERSTAPSRHYVVILSGWH